MNPMDMSGKSIVVTGASSGIGRACAVLLSRLDGHVILVARDHDRLKETATMLAPGSHKVEAFDLTRIDEIPDWLKALALELGPIDGVVHAAGVLGFRPIRMLRAEHLNRVSQINVYAAIALARGFARRGVCVSEGGAIVFLSSVMGLVGQPGQVAYAASKGALIAAMRSLALELAPARIRVNCVAPGVVETEMTAGLRRMLTKDQFTRIIEAHPLGLGTPEDIAYAVAFLLAPASRWITGSTLVVDGGYTAH